MRISGRLPQGIVIDGILYQDYELREQIVADEIEVLESEHEERAMKSDGFYNVCIMARRLTLVGLEKPVTPDLLMAMALADFTHLLSAGKKQDTKRDSFRDAAEAAPEAPSGPDENGI